MQPVDAWRCAALALALIGGTAVGADEPLFRHRAPIAVERSAAFVRLPLPASAYANSQQSDLQDLRVVDARGERVPFAILAPRPDEAQTSEQLRAVALYPLPPRPAGNTAWPAPLELTVEADRISVRPRRGKSEPAVSQPPGWLIDLGERPRDEPAPQALVLEWSGPAEFSVGFAVETSDDLRQWRPGGHGQLLALASPTGALTQPRVALPAAPGRFVRVLWADASAAPHLSAAKAVTLAQRSVTLDAPTELTVSLSAPDPAPKDDDTRRALTFDLGAPLPLVQLDLDLGSRTQVAPVRLQGRLRADEAWQPLGGAVFYRIERDGVTSRSPAVAITQRVRFVRVVPDARSGTLDAAQTRLIARVQLVSLVFAAQGEAPYALLAGSAKASVGALPLATLVPSPDDERPRFGRATLGAWSEVSEAAQQAATEQRRAALRPWLLWAVLVLGVAVLAVLVWRLARQTPKVTPP